MSKQLQFCVRLVCFYLHLPVSVYMDRSRIWRLIPFSLKNVWEASQSEKLQTSDDMRTTAHWKKTDAL